ncbi:hypothetical protein PSU4_38460 [Pseudonocardia sulfidoxydans NBRC 16205]|uniref:Uncharacterized protein n=2 Tax=Pseudonocardia sulfidoxydans TaxID=54011 RepID=A0A511DJA4_9PSEU|nr:hypothetical protein PSU4_38460 [Pseudonocardia sulfidoxydans NBRC 16205]
MTLNVESSDVTADEEDRRVAIGELKGAAVALHSNDRDIERAGNGSVYAGSADAHQSTVSGVAPGSCDAERDVFQHGKPIAPHAVVGHRCEEAGSEPVKCPGVLEACELCARVFVDILSVDGPENATLP